VEYIIEAIPYLILGIGTGVYGILVGAGGGVILVPCLMIFFGVEPKIAAGSSLALVAINSISGTIAYKKAGFIDMRSGLLFSVAAIPGSLIAPRLLTTAPDELFKILFGLLLIGLAALIAFKPGEREVEKPSELDGILTSVSIDSNVPKWLNFTMAKRSIVSSKGKEFNFQFNESLATAFNLLLGFISSFFGTGGGFIRTPVLVSGFKFPIQVAVATSIFALSIYATLGAAVHTYLGNVDWYPTFIYSGVGLIIGGQIGARLMEYVKGSLILKILLFVVLIMGVYLILQGIWPEQFANFSKR
jgi:hypothetical protein